MGVLAPGSAQVRPSAQPPIDVSGNFLAHVSREGGGLKFSKVFLINFLAKSGNSKTFFFNSSFSEYFEGDLSQNLHSRKHFLRRHSELPTETVNAIVSRIKDEDSTGLLLKVENKQKIYQVIFSKMFSIIIFPSNSDPAAS